MKKNLYIQPKLILVNLEISQMIAQSLHNEYSSNTEYVKSDFNNGLMYSGRSVWDDDWSKE